MQPLIPFDSLTERDQLEVLKYLEATNIDDIEQAISILTRHNMKAENALNKSTFQSQPSISSFYTTEQEQQISDYASFIISERAKYQGCGNCLRQCGKHIKKFFKKLIPRCLKRLVRRNTFDNIYRHYTQVQFFQGNLEQALIKAQTEQKCVAIFNSRSFSKKLGYFLHDKDTSLILNNRFICVGYTQLPEEIRSCFEDRPQPCLIIMYKALLGKPTLLAKCPLQALNKQLIIQSISQYQTIRRHEKNVVIRYTNKLLMTYYETQGQDYLQDELPEDTYNSEIYQSQKIRQQQIKQYEQASKIRQKQQQQKFQQKRKIQQIIEQRSIRKSSVSEQPTDNQNIVNLQFRCPNGNKLKRRFGLSQLVSNIYLWVQTNDQIQFEQDPIRNFDLLMGYPPQSLNQLKTKTIAQAFEDNYQLITIKQL